MKPNLQTPEAIKSRRIVLRTAIITALAVALAYMVLAPKEKCKELVEVAKHTDVIHPANTGTVDNPQLLHELRIICKDIINERHCDTNTIHAFYNHSEIKR